MPSPSVCPLVIHCTTTSSSASLLDLLPAWLVSTGAHGVVLLLFFLVTFSASAGVDTPVDEPIYGDVVSPSQDPDLTNVAEGLDPDVDSGIPDLHRLGDKNLAGINVPNEPVGPAGNAELPFVMEPPPGLGNGMGAAAGVAALGAPIDPFAGAVPPGLPGGIRQEGGIAARFLQGETLAKVVMLGGGSPETQTAVGQGLEWLAMHQSPSGGWSMEGFHRAARDKYGPGAKTFTCNCTGHGQHRADVAATALGVLPFLAAGQTHQPAVGAKRDRDYTKVVAAALRFLLAQQDKKTGQFGGDMYEQGLATIALCEGYGMTADPALKVPAQNAIDYVVRAQHGAGGWRYGPGQQGDTSVTGWQVMALKSGQMAGLSVPTPALSGATKFLNSVMGPTTNGYGYQSPGSDPRLTAVGLLCRQYLGWTPRKPEMMKGLAILQANPPAAKDMYYTYYASQVMHHLGGQPWRDWNTRMIATMLQARDKGADPKHPHQKGSWDPQGDFYGDSWGRVGQTALSVLTLQVYYRHLPLYRRELATVKPEDGK